MSYTKTLTSLVLLAALTCGSPTEGLAKWHPQPLPGIGGGNTTEVLVYGGVAAAIGIGSYLWRHKHRDERQTITSPAAITVGPTAVTTFKLENHGASPIQLAEAVPKSYELVNPPALPVIIHANEGLELKVRAVGAPRRGSIELSILDGKRTRDRVVLIRPEPKNLALK